MTDSTPRDSAIETAARALIDALGYVTIRPLHDDDQDAEERAVDAEDALRAALDSTGEPDPPVDVLGIAIANGQPDPPTGEPDPGAEPGGVSEVVATECPQCHTRFWHEPHGAGYCSTSCVPVPDIAEHGLVALAKVANGEPMTTDYERGVADGITIVSRRDSTGEPSTGAELDSPNFVHPDTTALADRGFERTHRGDPSIIGPASHDRPCHCPIHNDPAPGVRPLTLSKEGAAKLIELMANPPEPTERLKKAVAAARQTGTPDPATPEPACDHAFFVDGGEDFKCTGCGLLYPKCFPGQ